MQKFSLSHSDDFPFDRSTAPRPLYRRSEDGGVSISFREGEAIRISRADMPRNRFFSLTAFASTAFGGKPVRCSNFLPGVSLRIALSAERVGNDEEQEQQFLTLWEGIREPLDVWLCKGAGASALELTPENWTYVQRDTTGFPEVLDRPLMKEWDTEKQRAEFHKAMISQGFESDSGK